ncbi:MAG TPA: undecaprenyldiphospho-muramoylpentapeptide beta-N-acetylglucosaminyltransferase [Longimicrobiales bacterium]
MIRVLFAGGGTGGHLYPALAIGAAMQAENPAVEVEYVGAFRGVEARILPQRGVPHTLLPLQPIQRDRVWRNWRLLPAGIGTMTGLAKLFLRFKPSLVVGTGGYVSGPACAWAVLTNVPIAIQEQNSHPGFTTRVLSRFARQVHLGFPEAAKQLNPGRNTQVLSAGNPIVPPDSTIDRSAARARYGVRPDSTVLLVVGGSQGSRAVNEALLAAIEGTAKGSLAAKPADLEIVWATGPSHIDGIQSRLAALNVDWVHAHGYIDAMPQALAAADVAVSRAGAMATAELLAWGIPMILIPLPTAAADHQRFNAQALAGAGAAVMVEEKGLTPAALWSEVLALTADRARRDAMRNAALERARPDAAREIARSLLSLVAA